MKDYFERKNKPRDELFAEESLGVNKNVTTVLFKNAHLPF